MSWPKGRSSRTHGYSNHPLYHVWFNMRDRCCNKNHVAYKDYGGRGISVCLDWLNNPKAFIQWALCHGWEKGLWIDRIDNNGNYELGNCRFVNTGLSARNQRLLKSNNITGYRGVCCHSDRKTNQYSAQISINGKVNYLGEFDSPVLAALRYDVEAYLLNDGRPRNFF